MEIESFLFCYAYISNMVYFIGIGGVSMSALAHFYRAQGLQVAGSDATESEITKKLHSCGINVYQQNLQAVESADLIVYSSAIHEDNVELKHAREIGKRIISRGEALGNLALGYEKVIAVAGAHGKTTTTALIAKIFTVAGLNPTVHIGGNLSEEESNFIIGGREFFITEACEYTDNFLYLHPHMGVVLNVEAEHLDYFGTFERVQSSFRKFLRQSENIIAPFEYSFQKRIYTYKNYHEDKNGLSFDCFKAGEFYISIKSTLHGLHNVKNILTAIEVAEFYGVKKEIISLAIANFKGVKRRFEKRPFKNGSTLIFDYAHHPKELEKTITIVRKLCKGKLIVVFQPHTYSRTKAFFEDFIKVLMADRIIIFKTYSAREEYDEAGDAYTLYNSLLSMGRNAVYSEDYHLLKTLTDLNSDDIVLVLGAGDFYDKCSEAENFALLR